LAELKTEPAFALPRGRRPWWAVALITGAGAGAAIVAALGLASMQGRAAEPPPVRTSGVAQVQTDAEWRAHIDAKLTELGERLARIEGRLDRR
jgi:hypothetical protein